MNDDDTPASRSGLVIAFRGPGATATAPPARIHQAIVDALPVLGHGRALYAMHSLLSAFGAWPLIVGDDPLGDLIHAIRLAGDHLNLPPAQRVALGLAITRWALLKGRPDGADPAVAARARDAALEGVLAQMGSADQAAITRIAAGIVEARQGDIGALRRAALQLFGELFSLAEWAVFIARAGRRVERLAARGETDQPRPSDAEGDGTNRWGRRHGFAPDPRAR